MLDKKNLENIINKIHNLKDTNINEENTRGNLIDPILQALGWNIFDLNEVSRNAKTSSGFVDYVLKIDNKKVYLEAKPLNKRLVKQFQTQTTNYAYEDNIPFCVLTDGNRYQIFETYKKTNVSDRLLIDVVLNNEEVSLEKKLEYLNFLSKENVKNGSLERINEILNLQNQVNEVIQTIFSNPSDKFIEVISSELDQKFEKESIRKAITKIGNEINFQESQISDNTSQLSISGKRKSQINEKDIKFLTDKLPELRDIFMELRKKIVALGKDILEIFYPQYNALGFRRDTEFTSMKVKPKNKEVELLLKFGEFEPKLENLEKIQIEPLPKTYRYGRVNYRVLITEEDQIDEVIKLVKQCYDLQLKWRK